MKENAGVYLLGGITIVSEVVLPELPLIQPEQATAHPVNIRWGEVQDPCAEAIEIDPDCFATATQYFLHIHGVARYVVRDGREIFVTPEAGALPLNVRAYLLGTIFTVLCQQRGLLPLHASAVSAGSHQGVAAFLGLSGRGKSSLAAHLAERGFRVLADDVCLINLTPPDSAQKDEAMVIPTAPWLKLWRNSLHNLGMQAEGLDRVFSEDDKYRLPLAAALEPEPIRRLVFLDNVSYDSTGIEPVSGVEAVPLLMNLIHQAYVLQATGQRQEGFLRCSRVSSQAKAYRLQRPWGLAHLEATVDALERFLLMER